jgi:hypothetical protein
MNGRALAGKDPMARPSHPRRKPVTSDPDRPANSGTDPQRPGEPALPPSPGPATGGASSPDPFEATHRPSPARDNDVEGTKTDPDDAL